LNTSWYSPLLDPSSTHIIFTNGSNDPWSRLSLVPGTNNAGHDYLMMDGAAHCNDLSAFTSLPSVMAAQVRFAEIIKSWL